MLKCALALWTVAVVWAVSGPIERRTLDWVERNPATDRPAGVVALEIQDSGENVVGVLPDCNDNGIADACDIDCGPAGEACDVAGCGLSDDCNGNALPDECELGQRAKLTSLGTVAYDNFGDAVALSGDAAVVGASLDDCTAGRYCGAAYVYRFDGSNWVEEAKLTASDAADGDYFGISVSMSGETVVVGAKWDDCAAGVDCGAAYVYRFDGSRWLEEAKLTASDPAASDIFGASVSVNADTAVIGAPTRSYYSYGETTGAAYVYRFDGTSWAEESKLAASDAELWDNFGASVSVSGNTAVVGASLVNCEAGSHCGAVYVFRFEGTSWLEETKLTAYDAAQGDVFGKSVSVNWDTAVVGASGNDCAAGNSCGAAYVYRFDGISWAADAKLTPSDPMDYDNFGVAVSVNEDTAVVGANGYLCAAGIGSCAAYVYRFVGINWVEEAKLTAFDEAAYESFGVSVSVGGNMAVVGGPRGDCAAGSYCGAAYMFAVGSFDCNGNGLPDDCDVVSGGDFDEDDAVTLKDWQAFIDCMAGPGESLSPSLPGCAEMCRDAFDFNGDEAVDLKDVAVLLDLIANP